MHVESMEYHLFSWLLKLSQNKRLQTVSSDSVISQGFACRCLKKTFFLISRIPTRQDLLNYGPTWTDQWARSTNGVLMVDKWVQFVSCQELCQEFWKSQSQLRNFGRQTDRHRYSLYLVPIPTLNISRKAPKSRILLPTTSWWLKFFSGSSQGSFLRPTFRH